MARASSGGGSNGGTALATQPQQSAATPAVAQGQAPARGIRSYLEASSERLAAVLPKHLTPERLVQVVSTLVYRTPRLQECDRDSILASVMRAASLGLDLEPSACEAYLVPRYNGQTRTMECQFQPGYQGLRKLAMRTGRYALIEARLVYEGDSFAYGYEPDLDFHHVPTLNDERRGPVVAAYAVAKQVNGERQVKVLTVREIEEHHHQRSESYRTAQRKGQQEQGPWVTDWGEMARKSALIALCKDLEKSHELIEALAAEYAAGREEATPPASPSVQVTARGSRAAALAARLGAPEDEPAFAPGTSGQIGVEADEAPQVAPREPGEDP